MPARLEELRHDRQAARSVGREQGLVVAVDGRQGEVVAGQSGQHAGAGGAVGEGDVDGQGEQRRPVAREHGGDAGHGRGTRPGVGHDLGLAEGDGVAEIEPLALPERDDDGVEQAVQERQVALQEGLAFEHEVALVDAGAAAAAAGQQHADRHLLVVWVRHRSSTTV